MRWVATWVDGRDPRRRWALRELLDAAGVPTREVDSPDPVASGSLLVHGIHSPATAVLTIPVDPAWEGAWTAAPFDAGVVDAFVAAPTAAGDTLPFDVVGLVAALLDDAPGRAAGAASVDAHGRLRHAGADALLVDRPLVDRIADAIGAWLEARLGIARVPRWPGGASAVVALSHDVDHPDRYGILQAVLRDPRRLRGAPRTVGAAAAAQARARVRDRNASAFWAFDELIASEARRGYISTYLFAATPFHGPWGSSLDVAYDVAEARFQPVFRALVESGNEIGLHAGYDAWAAHGRIAAERERLERAAGVPVRGNRHHYWHLGPDPASTLREHGRAGLAWDASLAFNDHPGFRRSVSVPFHPWDGDAAQPVPVLQLPTACMDGAIFYRDRNVDRAVATLDQLLGTVVEAGGVLNLDWHLQASVPTNPEFRPWAEAYQALLDVVASRGDLWVTGLDALERHWTLRREALRPAG